MSFEMNRDWVKTLAVSLPDYADELRKQLENAMSEQILNAVDAHACAFGAALADRNGELAFEISMSNVLFGNDIRNDIAKAVIDLMIDNEDTMNEPTLYKLAIAHASNNIIQVEQLADKLSQLGVEGPKIEAAKRIAKLIPAISRCLV